MDPTAISPLLTPIVQGGLAGVCAILFAVLIWLISTLVKLQRDTIEAIKNNTEAIHDISKMSAMISDIRDRMLSRPCIGDFRNMQGDNCK